MSVQIGAVLLLGVLVILLAANQAAVVPAQNADVEAAHSERVQSDLLDARNAIVRAASSGNTRPVSVELGTEYPDRFAAVDPPPAGGALGPSDASGNVSLVGAEPIDGNAASYWTENGPMTYDTAGVRYEPSYREYGSAPATVYENTVLYNDFGGGTTIPLSDQSIVDGRTISLIALQDPPERSGSRSVGVDVHAISPSSTEVRSVAVRSETDGEPPEITFPTGLGTEAWNDLLEDEIDDGHVESVSVDETSDEATITLATNVTYNVRTAAVTAGDDPDSPDPAYVTLIDGANRSVPENTTNALTAEVRDRYNNPVSGERVSANFSESFHGVSPSNAQSTELGRASFQFESTDADADDGTASVSLDGAESASNSGASTSLSSFVPADVAAVLPDDVTRASGSSGRVRIPYAASGTGDFSVTLGSPGASSSETDLNVYSLEDRLGDLDGPVRIDPDGNITEVTHEDVNGVDYSNETLYVPPNSTFGPEDGEEDIDYTFDDYDLDGDVTTAGGISLTATDGTVSVGGTGSVISGRQLDITANGPNGSIQLDGATVTTTAEGGSPGQGQGVIGIDLETTGDISATDATMETAGNVEFDAGGSIDLTDASILVTANNDIALTADDDVILVRATLDIDGNGNAFAEAVTGVVDVTDARFLDGADPLEVTGNETGTPVEGGTA
ncbi:hypothetical protein [Halorubrum trueperi]|uniref:Big-1 domain-containing protein n=1 Tax=Halorubrum trueperi TaxID=2004704 RepID=A0ABD5UN72_9EURY